MTPTPFSRRLGENLKNIRLILRISAEDVADRLGVSTDAIYKYERGERQMTIEFKYKAAAALGINPQNFEDNLTGEPLPALRHELRTMSPDESRIMRWLASTWDGNVKAMITFIGLLAAMPKEHRREIYMQGIILRDKLLASGELTPEQLPAGMAEMEEALGKLYDM